MSVWPHIAATGRRIGYARVSTKDQKLRMQLDALNAVNCDLIFEDHGVSGTKTNRNGLDALMAELNSGDTVVVFKLDRLGRSVLHLADLLVRFQSNDIHFCSISEGINTTIYHASNMIDLAEEFVAEGLLGEIPDHHSHYIDYDAIARDLAVDYSETEIAGDTLTSRAA